MILVLIPDDAVAWYVCSCESLMISRDGTHFKCAGCGDRCDYVDGGAVYYPNNARVLTEIKRQQFESVDVRQ